MLFVHQSSEEIGLNFFADAWPEVAKIADPDLAIFKAFGLQSLSFWEFLRRSSFSQLFRALKKGHFIGGPKGGQVLQEPGVFLIQGQDIIWHHAFQKGIGDLPNWNQQPWNPKARN